MFAKILWIGSCVTAAILLGIVWGALLLAYRYCRRVYSARAAAIDSSFGSGSSITSTGRVALVCPCKGLDARTEANARRLLNQDYPDYTVTFITESADDSAVPILERLVAQFPRARHRIAGRAKHHTQKIHNILCAMNAAADAEILASVDIDMEVPDTDWLRRLVAPLAGENVAISTSFFRIVTEGRHPIEQLCAQITTVMEIGMTAWRGWLFGGSFAMRRSTFTKLDVPRIWHQALAEDVWLTLEVLRRGLEVVYVPTARSANVPTRRLRSLWIWWTRQLLAIKHFPLMFWPLLLIIGASSALLCQTPILLGYAKKHPEFLAPGLLGAGTMFAFTAALLLAALLPPGGGAPRTLRLTHLIIPLILPLTLAAMIVVALRRHLLWAGIRYELLGDASVRRVVFPDEESPKESTDPLPDWTQWWRQGLLLAFPGLMKLYARTRIRSLVELFTQLDPAGKRVLELGAGTGTLSDLIAARTGVQVTLLDNNQEAFRLYRKLSGHGTYVCADAFAYQPEAPFDIVFSDGLIEHFHAPERAALLRAHRVLASPEGAVVIFVPKDSWFVRNIFKMRGGLELKYTFPRLEAELRAAGLIPVAHAEDWHMIGVTCRNRASELD